jgi:hypothetical protein
MCCQNSSPSMHWKSIMNNLLLIGVEKYKETKPN